MEQKHKDLLLKDLGSRLYCGVKVTTNNPAVKLGIVSGISIEGKITVSTKHADIVFDVTEVKPYLRPMSSMTEEEAKELSILYGFKDILSTKITDKYVEFVVDDGFCSSRKIWYEYDDIISSIEIVDWLNAHYFDYRNLIERGLAIEVTEENNPYKR